MIRTALALTALLSLIACETSAEPPGSGPAAIRASASKTAGPPSNSTTPIHVAAPTPGPAVKPAEPDAKPAERDRAERDKEDRNQPVTVDSDRMERFGKESLVIFTGNVVARQNNSVQYADRMEVYLDEKGDRILRTVSTGNIRIITKDCRTGTARRAEYYDLEQRVVLTGGARVWQDDNVVSGETITIYLSQDRSVVQAGAQERVKAVFFPREQNQQNQQNQPKKDANAPAKTAATACAN
jgi:lipopolysaccharide export system protein LptA